MSTTAYQARIFTPLEILFWATLLGGTTALCVGAALTHQNPPIPSIVWVFLVLVEVSLWVIAAAFLVSKARRLANLHFVVTPPGLVVGWSNPSYAVKPEACEKEVVLCLGKMIPAYPGASAALAGCLVYFRETTWVQDASVGTAARMVAGVQDGQLMEVGWRADVSTSALQHELAHRVLQVCAGDPPEAAAHEIMRKLGIL